ncbi:DUF1501 domain-containing protein [Fimbriimonas ginsengisoli]|uniref:Sulfatase n=1 Tax=Fimbriimonas ginsengisoli Gsoil 348 TaxID=661478 RepID=A0A068NIM9_FIMGI|nr:DUF1501 domain-containing protein [Fimbriimonas ginsengisoli]AIE83386.1 hypothetical protein OP10G_0018 [Fimbriimonas ginsengisoli Gsoil 348]
MNPFFERDLRISRRQLFGTGAKGIGVAALAGLLTQDGFASLLQGHAQHHGSGPLPGLPHFPPKAKRVIVLWQGGAPSQVDLFDYKPELLKHRLEELPASLREGTRLSTMTSGQNKFPILPAIKPFRQYGQSGMWLSEMIPHTGSIADDICLVKSMHTDAVNHAPGVTFFLTGSQIPGRPSMGAWATYGLGSMTDELPAFVVMTSSDEKKTCGQLFYDYYWGSGFIPSKYQGVRFRSEGEPVLYLNDPPGMSPQLRRGVLDDIAALDKRRLADYGDPEIETRITQYELAFKMQTSVPELTDISKEPKSVLDMYGPDVEKHGSYAHNCLLARRLVERGVRFVQLMHSGWDQHTNLDTQLALQCRDTDQPSAALVKDLKQRGLLDDTIVLWCGEFGRTVFVQGDINRENGHGRDHFGACYSLWAAGGGFKGGAVHGETDDFCYKVVKDPVSVHDMQATILRQLGIDHERLTYEYQGRNFRLTDVSGQVVPELVKP